MTEYRYKYNSPMKEYFYAFLDFKTSTKQDVFSYAFLFKHFDKFLIDNRYEKAYIDKGIYMAWQSERMSRISAVTLSRECSMIRTFLIFVARLGNDCYIPPSRREPDKTYIPHIFSYDELSSLFKAADSLRLKNRSTHNQLHAIPALLRLLYSTGMRIGEALELRNKDIDLKTHVIKLRKTKNGHERISPINESLESVLQEYVLNRNRLAVEQIQLPDGYFFCSAMGKKCDPCTVRNWFHAARDEAGIPYYGREGGPNVHCLRHTACVHALMKMVKSGKDPYCCLPVLASFMGHRDVKDTEYYLHLCEELYPDIIRLERSISSGVNSIIHTAIKQYEDENR